MKNSVKIATLALIGAGLVSCGGGASEISVEKAQERALGIAASMASYDFTGKKGFQSSFRSQLGDLNATFDIRYLENSEGEGIFGYYKETYASAYGSIPKGSLTHQLIEFNNKITSKETSEVKYERKFIHFFETNYAPTGAKSGTLKVYKEYSEEEFKASLKGNRDNFFGLLKEKIFSYGATYLMSIDGEKSFYPEAPADVKFKYTSSGEKNLTVKGSGTSYTEECKFDNNYPAEFSVTIGNKFARTATVFDVSNSPNTASLYLSDYKKVDTFDDTHPSFEKVETYNEESIIALKNAYK